MQCEILSFSPSIYSGSSTDIIQVKCTLPSGGLLLVDMNNTSRFLFLYHSITTKTSTAIMIWKVRLSGKQQKAFFGHKKAKQH